MAFRDKGEADQFRIDALEDGVHERDAEIAHLKAALEESEHDERKPAKKQRKKKRPTVPEVADLPGGDTWAFETHDPNTWKYGAGWLAVVVVVVGATVAQGTFEPTWLIFVAIFGVPGLWLFHRSGLVLDRRRRQVTRWDWLLVRIRRSWPVEDEDLALQTRLVSPKNGSPYWMGDVFLGKHKLLSKKKGIAEQLARRMAAFLQVGVSTRQPSDEELRRRAGCGSRGRWSSPSSSCWPTAPCTSSAASGASASCPRGHT